MKIPTFDIKYHLATLPSLFAPPGREATTRLLRKFKDTPVKPAGAVEIIDKNAYRT